MESKEQKQQLNNNNNQEESLVLQCYEEILKYGVERNDRTGVGTKSLFGKEFVFSLLNGQIPLLTTKKMFLRGIFEELKWILEGQTDSKILEAKKINIWKDNTSRAFLDAHGFKHLREGDGGPIYGFHLRHFGAQYVTCDTKYDGQGIDQLAFVMNELKQHPDSRRAMITFYNPAQIGVLPPCHAMVQFETKLSPIEGQPRILSAILFQRSADMFLGFPFNIASYSLWIILMAHHLGFQPGRLIHCVGNAHIYKTHEKVVQEQIKRKPFSFPKLTIKTKRANITDYVWEDIVLQEYQCHGELKGNMAV